MARQAIQPALGMSAAALARRLEVPTNRTTAILNGQRAITGDTALRLAHFFGSSAEFWLDLQGLYELRLAEQKAGRAIKALPTLERTRRKESPVSGQASAEALAEREEGNRRERPRKGWRQRSEGFRGARTPQRRRKVRAPALATRAVATPRGS